MAKKKKITREDILAELEAIRLGSIDGMLYARDVVAYAKANPKSAIASKFEWDQGKAAEAYWLATARQLIRVHVVVRRDAQQPIRAYVSLQSDRKSGGGYRRADDVLQKKSLRAELVEQALLELQRFRAKYATLEELSDVLDAIDNTVAQEVE